MEPGPGQRKSDSKVGRTRGGGGGVAGCRGIQRERQRETEREKERETEGKREREVKWRNTEMKKCDVNIGYSGVPCM